ncbi:hypothetical protein JL09_g1935 [Pichia kudriavzevii]|uniref:Tyrosine-protein phosphatase OCA6 n=1 Tax=Pichia kudriavzevii TaxID=4909 RepID=A0A099P3V7_PICKU|nr:hypothetical protein JL09_g1935 [Pichia kudriavzevii]
MDDKNTFIPPANFNRVQTTLVRGGRPKRNNIPFLKFLGIDTMVALTERSLFDGDGENGDALREYIRENGIPITHGQVMEILEIILNKEYGNVYIYCYNGGQITSLVVACLRKLQLWSTVSIFDEFIHYGSNVTHNDRTFVQDFVPQLELSRGKLVEWIWSGLNENIIVRHPGFKNVRFIG